MIDFLKAGWRLFQKAGLFIGNIVSGIFLFIFYYTIFALFATPFRLFSKPFDVRSRISNWISRETTPDAMDDFERE